MKLAQFKNVVKNSLASISLSTMTLMPVAQGQEAEKIKTERVKASIIELGLNKSQTFGEFYKRNKSLYPERIQKQLAVFAENFKDEPMPVFEVSDVKNKFGETIPVVQIKGRQGELHQLQVNAEKENFVKFDNTKLTEEDLVNFDDMFSRLYRGDAKLRRQVAQVNTSNQTLSQQKFFQMNANRWKKMTPYERAEYIIQLRLLYSGAIEVLEKNQTTSRKTSSLEKWNYFLNFLFEKAEAAGGDCVIAGYIGSYGKGLDGRYGCQYPQEKQKSSSCKAVANIGQLPCNPTIYGYAADGGNLCVSSRAALQTATLWNGACDSQMKLSVAKLSLPAVGGPRDSSRYTPDVVEKNKAEALQNKEEMSRLTQTFLDSVLNAKENQNPETAAVKKAFKEGVFDEKALNYLKQIETNFNLQIGEARTKCAAAANQKHADKNFFDACDQLHRRFLFISETLRSKCPSQDIDENSLMCKCPSGSPVFPGAQCSQAPVVVSPPPVGGGNPVASGPAVVGGMCPDNMTPCDLSKNKCVLDSSGEAGDAYSCVPLGGIKDDKKGGGFWSGVGSFLKKAAPWILGGVGLFAMYKLWSPKKPSLAAAGDKCPNGTIPPCAQQCTLPKAILADGQCGCTACPPGQSLTDANACICSTNSAGGDSSVTCADGVTKAPTLAECPAQNTFTCWNGTVVNNPINCPVKPTGTTAPAGSAN